MSQSNKTIKNVKEIDDQTPKTKFKSIMRKFNDEKRRKSPKKSQNISNNLDISYEIPDQRGESQKGESILMLTPSSVKNGKESAVARAKRGQYLTKIRQGKMYGNREGKSDSNGKRKCNFSDDFDNYSPKKIPKTNLYQKNNFNARLGIDPGRGRATDRPGSSSSCVARDKGSPDGQFFDEK